MYVCILGFLLIIFTFELKLCRFLVRIQFFFFNLAHFDFDAQIQLRTVINNDAFLKISSVS